jgi:hypothetical protein
VGGESLVTHARSPSCGVQTERRLLLAGYGCAANGRTEHNDSIAQRLHHGYAHPFNLIRLTSLQHDVVRTSRLGDPDSPAQTVDSRTHRVFHRDNFPMLELDHRSLHVEDHACLRCIATTALRFTRISRILVGGRAILKRYLLTARMSQWNG